MTQTSSSTTKTSTLAGVKQFIESLIITGLIAAFTAGGVELSKPGAPDWKIIGGIAGLAFLFSVAHGIAAYLKTLPAPTQQTGQEQPSPDLRAFGTTLEALINIVQQHTQVISSLLPFLQGVSLSTLQQNSVQTTQTPSATLAYPIDQTTLQTPPPASPVSTDATLNVTTSDDTQARIPAVKPA